MAGVLQHLRSSTLDKRPNPASMVDGQVAINYASGSPGMFFKDSNGDLVKVGPVHVGTTAPNVSPASGGTAGNSKGEQWLDTSGGTYVFKIWDGAAWRSEAGEFVNVTGDTMTGALGIIAGSASTPGLFFSGDTNTGIYSPGADQVAISTNGTGRLFVNDSGTVTVSSAALNFGTGGVSGFISANNYWGASSSDWNFNAGHLSQNFIWKTTTGTERMRLDSSGRLGLGTSSPSSKLDVRDADVSQIRSSVNGVQTAVLGSDTSTGAYTGTLDNYPYNFLVNGSVKATLTSTGLGVGTTNVPAPFCVSRSGNEGLEITPLTGNQVEIQGYNRTSSNWVAALNKFSQHIWNLNSTTEAARIDSSGRLLVGTSSAISNIEPFTTPSHQFVGNDTTTGGGIVVLGKTASSTLYLSRGQSGNTVASGDSIGRVNFTGYDGAQYSRFASIGCEADAAVSSNDSPGRLVFSTTADGASSPTERMRIHSGGAITTRNGLNVGDSSMANGGAAFYLNGSIIGSGAGTYPLKWNNSTAIVTYDTSSRLLKENISDCPYGLDVIKQLQPRKYFRIDDQKDEIGFIADEVAALMPEFVPIGPKSVVTRNAEDTEEIPLGVNYDKLTAVLTKALQEAVTKIESLEARLTAAGI